MGVIVFNGISSKDIGLEVETFPAYEIPEKEYDVIHVPGRSGDLVIDSGTYKNVPRSYEVSIATRNFGTYSQTMNRVAEWLHSASGYARLEDSYDGDFYRLAYYKDNTTLENIFDEAGRGTIKFICKPMRFLKSGEIPLVFTASQGVESSWIIQNRTINPSSPIIKVTKGDTIGSLVVGDITLTFSSDSGSPITVDCELQDAYNGTVNKNNVVTLTSGVFPKLYPGNNTISFNGGITNVEIIPRWWTI